MKYVLTYIDDFTTFSSNFGEHLFHFENDLKRLQEAGLKLKLKPTKCFFGQSKIAFLGHEILAAGIQLSEKKVEAINKFPHPDCLKAVKSFLGLTRYYRRYVPNFATLAEPLIALTKKDTPFGWAIPQIIAFKELQKKLTNFPILRHFNPTVPLEIHTDASSVGVSAVLIQRSGSDERIIAYASKTLNQAQRNYGATQLQLYAVVFGIEKFKHICLGIYLVMTDHSALVPLLKTKNPIGQLAKWLFPITPYAFQIVYRPSCENVLADALSRYPANETQQPIPNCVEHT